MFRAQDLRVNAERNLVSEASGKKVSAVVQM